SFFPDAQSSYDDRKPVPDDSRLAEQAMLREELAHQIHSETEFTGELFRRVRESQGIELEEISKKTKISVSHLRAIENDAFADLPAEVYTRGFVGQMAQFLGLDATQATRTYVRRVRAARRAHTSEVPR